MSLGADYIATGHYAKVEYNEKYKQHVLKKANDETNKSANKSSDSSFVDAIWNLFVSNSAPDIPLLPS